MKQITVLSLLTATLLYGQALEDIVITAKSESLAVDTAGSFSIVTKEEIEKMSATSINEILEEMVGISVGINSSSIGGRKSISIRGADSKHSLILVDGKKVSGSDAQIGHSDFQYNWLPLNAIEKIEVIRGPMSSLYGSSAIGGVVNIITKKPTDEVSGEIKLRAGKSSDDGGDETDISLMVGGKITDKLSATLFFQKEDISVTKNDKNPIFTADIEGKDISNGMLNLYYNIDDSQQLTFSTIQGKEIREYIVRVPGKTVYYDEYYEIDKRHYSLGYLKEFDELSMELKYYTTESESHSDEYQKSHDLDSDVMNAEFVYDGFDTHYVVAGVEKRIEKYTQDHDPVDKEDFHAEIDYLSAYVQDEVKIGEKTLLTLGLRYDKHERFGRELSPKAGLVYKLDERSRLKTAYGHGFNAPTVTQNSSAYKFFGPHNFFGNDDLLPETSDSYEIGYEYQDGKNSFKLTAYQTDIDDLIHFVPVAREGDKTTYLYSNVKKAKMQGVEIEYAKEQILSNLDIKMGYHYLKTEDENGHDITAKPKHKANIRLNSKLPYEVDGTLRIKYTGEQYDLVDNEFKKLDGYTTVGLQFAKKYSDFTARLGAENLLDKKLDAEYFYKNRGRLVYFEVEYRF